MRKLRSGDTVIIISGKSKGQIGSVKSFRDNNFLLVSGVNLASKHTKSNPMRGEVGGIVKKEMPVHISNVAIYNSETKKRDRVVIKLGEDGKKYRFLKSNGQLLGR